MATATAPKVTLQHVARLRMHSQQPTTSAPVHRYGDYIGTPVEVIP